MRPAPRVPRPMQEQREALLVEHRAVLNVPAHAMPFLQPGRVCRVCRRPPGAQASAASTSGAAADGEQGGDNDDDDGSLGVFSPSEGNGEGSSVWGVVVNFERIGGAEGARAVYAVDVLVRAEEPAGPSRRGAAGGAPAPALLPIGARGGAPRVVQVPLEQLDRLSKLRIYMDKDMRPLEARNKAASAVTEVLRRFPDGVPLLDPEADMKIESAAFRKLVRRIETLEGMLGAHRAGKAPDLAGRLAALRRKRRLAEQAKQAGKRVKEAQTLILKVCGIPPSHLLIARAPVNVCPPAASSQPANPNSSPQQDDLKARKRVLTRLGFVSEDGVVQLKGRLAAEITTCDELVARRPSARFTPAQPAAPPAPPRWLAARGSCRCPAARRPVRASEVLSLAAGRAGVRRRRR